ncbi:MAG TPA: alpha/beta hydrolase [Petrotogaceae bacterium]|nr:alpha/beta hydrolase [Petrotogaceae bacterium]HOG33611.1 alpha/beta hydrolase [Petrotogaceae bacterium]HQC40365.1 alpha/beta hydrolase [Petrotogaceae bacterium]
MKIDFSYEKKPIDFISGYIYKGSGYKCNYIRFPTLYKTPARGTETVELYNFQAREKSMASVLILHGLGSSNVKFLLWMGNHLASSGIDASILILPGNYTRVDDNSTSGRGYVYPDINVMYNFWQHAVVDVMSTIDFLKEKEMWAENNCVLGYCLGGMVGTIVSSMRDDIGELILMTAGGHLPKILYESPATRSSRYIQQKKNLSFIEEKERIYRIYEKQMPLVRNMCLTQLIESEEIHPIFKVDPISYAHLVDRSKVTFFEAIFDRTIPILGRKLLWEELKKPKRYLLPIDHVSWLFFEYFLSVYIMNKLNIKGIKIKARKNREDKERTIDDVLLGK